LASTLSTFLVSSTDALAKNGRTNTHQEEGVEVEEWEQPVQCGHTKTQARREVSLY
jgi:hypothetical protein